MRNWSGLAVAAAVIAGAAPAAAATVTFAGSGSIGTRAGTLATTGLAEPGDAFSFSFSFDPAAAILYDRSDDEAVYDLSLTGFAAALGGYSFRQTADAAYVPTLVVSRGFGFFDANVSEPSLAFDFYFSAAPTTAAGEPRPFRVSPGTRDTLLVSAIFRAPAGDPAPDIALLRDPADAARRTFAYSTRDAGTRAFGSLRGSHTGGFAAAVPEPASWALLLFGFGATGAAVRRRPARRARAA